MVSTIAMDDGYSFCNPLQLKLFNCWLIYRLFKRFQLINIALSIAF